MCMCMGIQLKVPKRFWCSLSVCFALYIKGHQYYSKALILLPSTADQHRGLDQDPVEGD